MNYSVEDCDSKNENNGMDWVIVGKDKEKEGYFEGCWKIPCNLVLYFKYTLDFIRLK